MSGLENARSRHPLLSAPCLVAVGVLVLNDHVLKALYPGAITGKLSDFAGLVFFPWLLHAAWVLVVGAPRTTAGRRRLLQTCVWGVGVVFAAIQLLPFAGVAYAWGLGALQWGPAAALATLQGGPRPCLRPVVHTADPTDLLALAVLVLVVRPRTWWRGGAVALACILLAGCAGRYRGGPRGGPSAEARFELRRGAPLQKGRVHVTVSRARLEKGLDVDAGESGGDTLRVALGLGHYWQGPPELEPSVLTGTLRLAAGAESREDALVRFREPHGMLMVRADFPPGACGVTVCEFDVFVEAQWHHPSDATLQLVLEISVHTEAQTYPRVALRPGEMTWIPEPSGPGGIQ